jgi:hypothetical protein
VTHLPFVAAAYLLGTGLPIILTVQTLLRVRGAGRRLDAIDPRRNRNEA